MFDLIFEQLLSVWNTSFQTIFSLNFYKHIYTCVFFFLYKNILLFCKLLKNIMLLSHSRRFWISPCSSINISSILINCCLTFHKVEPLIVEGHFNCPHFFTIINCAAFSIFAHASLCKRVRTSLPRLVFLNNEAWVENLDCPSHI